MASPQVKRLWMAAGLSLSLLSLACTTAKDGDDSADSATCTALCEGQLDLRTDDESSEFSITLYGEDFTNLQLACPDGVKAGGPGDVTSTCVEGGASFTRAGLPFPEIIYVIVTAESKTTDEQALAPEWTESSICGSTCNTGSATFAVPPLDSGR